MYRGTQVRRGDIFYADLSPAIGSEQSGTRPVLILQNNVGNRYSSTLIVAAITNRSQKNQLPTHVYIGEAGIGLLHDSVILLEQLRTIDKSRLSDYIGSLSSNAMSKVNTALATSIGLTR